MGYERLTDIPLLVYHYTARKNVESILRDGKIKRMGDTESWFCPSLEDAVALMKATVMLEGKPYYKVGGSIGHYPKFVPEDFVILELTPRWQSGEWVRWNQELPPGAPPELVEEANAFSLLKLGFRGDMKFESGPRIVDVAPLLEESQRQGVTLSL